jgi:putative ABC transport system permease protein
MNAESYTIVGVLPEEVNSAVAFKNVQVWTPLKFDSNFRMTSNALAVVGRLKTGADIQQANREMQVVARNLESEFPDLDKGWSATVTSLQEEGLRDIRASLIGILVAVGFILLIACVNVANLLLARAEIRHKEVAIRSALGASRARLLRELFAENLLLALAGSLAGLAIAHGALRLLIVLGAAQLPRLKEARLDGQVLAFTLALTVFTALVFGLFPARQLLTVDLNRTLRQAGRGSIHVRMARRSRNLLVVSQVALSLVLVAGAGLMVQSLLWLQTQSRGFMPQHLLSFRVSVTPSNVFDQRRMAAYYLRMLDRIEALPGVRAVAAATNLPLDGYLMVGEHFRIDGAAPATLSERPSAACNLINTGYFKTIGTRVLEGREFDERDRADAPPVAVISATLARRFFSGQNPIGHKIVVPTPGKTRFEVAREIVGVAGDIHYLTRTEEDSAEIYLPYLQAGWPAVYVMVRTDGDPKVLAPAARAALGESGFEQPIAEVRTMEERIAELNGKPRLNSVLAVIFSGIALALAAVGIYGVISYTTAQRSQEIGVRMALGASAGGIVGWIMRQALSLAAAGVMLGLAGHFVLSRVLVSLLYGISPNDANTLASAVAVLILIAILASYVPARRAVKGDPMAALRAE